MNKETYDGYVLHRRPYRETSLLVDFFTEQNGRVSAVAKGARGGKSDRKSLLQPMQNLNFELSGRSALRNLGRVESNARPKALAQQALFCAFYLNEVLNRALPEAEPFKRLYAQYELSLDNLQSQSTTAALFQLEPILRNFEFVLLEELGYAPDFLYDTQNESEIKPEKSYTLLNEIGFCEASPQQAHAIRGKDILNIHSQDWDSDALKAAKKISRIALRPILGEKPIKSRELFMAKPTIQHQT
ncbi:DNA repair protein RecO [Glaciecola sp. MH2013]|uniref:DNA repair protein RecO n=1 Tax=Glaciecola sp. MH2013 TaxID=2785524 RepID=UPI00189ED95D|nr:DNA repair protein RecO [Glaciecola sp. MH2013]MBF7075063.1 DNA repair protein RecO [Glaciecola sp. MH2013]